jgi:hypothetical protein
LGVATLTAEPKRRDGVWTAKATLGKSGYPATLRFHDRPGDFFPYQKGDRVTYRRAEGDSASGLVVTGIYGAVPSGRSSSSRVVSGRSGDLEMMAPNGDTRVTAETRVRLGTGEDEDQKPVAIAEETARDAASLQAQLDQFLAFFSVYDPVAAPLLLIEMQKVIPGWVPLPYAGAPDQVRAPDAKPAVDVVAKPED